MDNASLYSSVAHEVGHLVGTQGLQLGLGDEYESDCSAFRCSANPPPASYSGTNGRNPFCGGFHCSDTDVQACGPWRGSKVVSAQDAPYEVRGRGALNDQLSFMGGTGADPDDYWVTPRAFDFLFANLPPAASALAVVPEADEPIATVSGWVTADGHARLDSAYQAPGSPPPVATGEYTVEVRSTQGALLPYFCANRAGFYSVVQTAAVSIV